MYNHAVSRRSVEIDNCYNMPEQNTSTTESHSAKQSTGCKNLCGILHENIPYATYGDVTVLLDLYMPAMTWHMPVPVVLFLHGGGWIRGDKSTIKKRYKNRLLGAFLKAGYAVVSANYRLAGYGATLREQIVDCRNMLDWICKNAACYNFDKNSIGIWGSSAGAHIAMYTAYSADSSNEEWNVSYILDNFGPVNLSVLLKPALPNIAEKAVKIFAYKKYMHRRVTLEAITGYDISEKKNICRFCKEYSLDEMEIANKVPTLILHGTADTVVPHSHSVNMCGKLGRCGVEVEMHLFENLDHGFFEYTDTDLKFIINSSLEFAKRHTRC